MSTAWHGHQISHLCILEKFDLLFGVRNRVDNIVSSLARGESAYLVEASKSGTNGAVSHITILLSQSNLREAT
jgi:hypothetical protein